MNNNKTVKIDFINSMEERFEIELSTGNQTNLMEVIRDLAYEDWGDCRGRAWCRTCHISVKNTSATYAQNFESDIEKDEEIALQQLYTRTTSSRLACQIY